MICMYDILSIGGTALDVFLQLHEASVNCRLDTDICQLCMNYADKIPVEKITNVAGVGSAPNTAVGSARLGLQAALYTVIGNDSAGKDSLAVFKKEKVVTKYVVVDKKNRTDHSTIISFQGERTLLTFQAPRIFRLPKDIKTKWIFLGALPNGHKILHEQLIKMVKKQGVKLVFNPGAHELREGIEHLKSILAVLEVLIINKEEAWRLLGGKDEDIKLLLIKLKNFGPKIVVITDGKNGAVSFDDQNFYHQSIYNLPVVEKTGAGDAFATGFIAALFYNLDIKEALQWGNANSANVIQHIGAQVGLLDKIKMKNFLARYRDIKPQLI